MRRLIDILWVVGWMFYVLAGTPLVPFHGDEATTIWMSRDYGYLVNGQVNRVSYQQPPVDKAEQQLRLITGALTKYLMGVSWQLNGYDTDDLNEQWVWGAGWSWNQQNGHAPDDTLLMLGRWPSALMLALSVPVMFVIAHITGARVAAYVAVTLLALNPAVLLNGRRAMFEGGLILFSLLVVLAGLLFVQKQTWRRALFLGVMGGLALAAKHTALFTLLPIFAGGAAILIWRYRNQMRELILPIVKISMASLVSLSLFYALHPVWWGDPIERVEHVIEARTIILQGQLDAFGGYTDFNDQINRGLQQIFVASPQYYEVPGWGDYIANEIREYEHSLWDGFNFGGSLPGLLIVLFLCVTGIRWLVSQQRKTTYLVLIWSLSVLMLSILINPIEWQRYYLIAYPAVGLMVGYGCGWLHTVITSTVDGTESSAQNEQRVR